MYNELGIIRKALFCINMIIIVPLYFNNVQFCDETLQIIQAYIYMYGCKNHLTLKP